MTGGIISMIDGYAYGQKQQRFETRLPHPRKLLSFRNYNALMEIRGGRYRTDTTTRKHLHQVELLRRKIENDKTSRIRDRHSASLSREVALLLVHLSTNCRKS